MHPIPNGASIGNKYVVQGRHFASAADYCGQLGWRFGVDTARSQHREQVTAHMALILMSHACACVCVCVTFWGVTAKAAQGTTCQGMAFSTWRLGDETGSTNAVDACNDLYLVMLVEPARQVHAVHLILCEQSVVCIAYATILRAFENNMLAVLCGSSTVGTGLGSVCPA